MTVEKGRDIVAGQGCRFGIDNSVLLINNVL